MLTLGVNSKPKLSKETFCLLRDIVYKKCGIYFGENKKYLLQTRLSRRLEKRNLKTFEDYYYLLMYDPARNEELKELFNSVVTNETSFFRDPAQLQVFSRGVVPKVIAEKEKTGSKTLRIWSAACSTGEEPYTVAMMLADQGLAHKGWTIEVLGSDISENVLRSAQNGVYQDYSVRNTPDNYLKKYFDADGSNLRVSPRVKGMVKFKKVNLVDSLETRMIKGMDIIFCRNVLIYFDDASKKKAVSHLYDSLMKGGFLIVGFSESLHNVTRLFRPTSIENSVVYQKI